MSAVTIASRQDQARSEPDMRGFPYRTFPSGWFQVAWSAELERGQVQIRHYWDRELIIWRGESGGVHLADAYCVRRGEHLGHGGVVVGDDVVCPVDGWRRRPDGSTITPDGRRVEPDGASTTFEISEKHGLVLAWYDEAHGPSAWEVPVLPLLEDSSLYPLWPHGVALEQMRSQPQLMAENIPDHIHVHYMHRWPEIPTICDWREEDELLIVDYEGRFPSKQGEVVAVFRNRAFGLGFLLTEMTSFRRFVQLICPIPIDHETMDIRLSAWVERAEGDTGDEPDNAAKAIIGAQYAEVLGPDVDRKIWENQIYVEHAPFRTEERSYVAFRKWAKQFYPHEQGPNAHEREDKMSVVGDGAR